jgi:DNA polymerase-3 subunit beta
MITLDVKTLREALRGFGKLNLRACKNDALKTVRFKSEAGVLRLFATDLDQSLIYTCEGQDHENGDFLVPLERLRASVLGAKANALLYFHPEEEATLIHIKDGGITSEIRCQPVPLKSYPEWQEAPTRLTSLTKDVVEALQQASGSASSDPNRYILNSVYMEPGGVVATNGRILYRATPLDLKLRNPLIVPNFKSLGLFDPEQPAQLLGDAQKPRALHGIAQGAWIWYFRPLDGTYPNYQQVLPKDESERVEIELSTSDVELLEGLARLPFTKTKDACATLRRLRGDLRLRIGAGDDRQVHQLRPVSIKSGSDTEVSFNFNYLMEGLRNGMRTLSFKDEIGSLTLRDDSRFQLFMPLRGNGGKQDWTVTHAGRSETEAAPASRKPARAAALAVKPEASVRSSASAEPEKDALADLIREATELRDSLKGVCSGIGQLIKAARRAGREHSDLEKEHQSLKRSVRSLQKLEV